MPHGDPSILTLSVCKEKGGCCASFSFVHGTALLFAPWGASVLVSTSYTCDGIPITR